MKSSINLLINKARLETETRIDSTRFAYLVFIGWSENWFKMSRWASLIILLLTGLRHSLLKSSLNDILEDWVSFFGANLDLLTIRILNFPMIFPLLCCISSNLIAFFSMGGILSGVYFELKDSFRPRLGLGWEYSIDFRLLKFELSLSEFDNTRFQEFL